MIEVNLYAIPAKDAGATVGRCIDRTRYDMDVMKVSVMEFVKGFLKTNVPNFDASVNNPDIISLINSDDTLTTKDFACINYYLIKSGYMVTIQNVTEDEENPLSIPAEMIEWNIMDYNFMQNGYPTTTKIVQSGGTDVVSVLDNIANNTGLFREDKFGGIKNPLKELVDTIKKIKEVKGSIEPGPVTKAYEVLDNLGIKVFCAVSED